ncbi:MAG TPA: sialidase family protein, partial [Candidatus Thermoplasmatota archaeon]|nr:sialidase family protein [Candidatus Thermoplasmatota archaeon]
GRQGNEVTIAVDPTNPQNIVGGAKDYFPLDAGECVWDGVYVTHDGARTPFADRSLDGSPWRLSQDPGSFKPTYASQFWCTTDPVAYFGLDGTFYYLAMAYQADRVTGSKALGPELEDPACPPILDCPHGALNDWAFNRATQIVAVSKDGGDTFDSFTAVFEGTYPVAFHDKGWVAASKDGVIHVMWLAGALPGNFYWRSTDGGKTYGDPFIIAGTVGDDSGQGSFVDVGPDKEVYAGWTGNDGIHVRRSLDEGKTWLATQTLLNPHGADMPGLSDRDRRGGFAAMATDRNAESPFANSVYFAFQDSCQAPTWSAECDPSDGLTDEVPAKKGENRGNIYVVASHDGGKTFGVPVLVNDDLGPDGNANPDNYQFMPAISVSPGGVLDVQWFDTRQQGRSDTVRDHLRVGQYYSYSLDGGKTWSKNLDIRDRDDGGWDPALSHHQDGKIFFGDYQDIDSSWQAAHPVWPDTRDGKEVKVYTATLQRPWFAEGWDAGKRATAEKFIASHPLT